MANYYANSVSYADVNDCINGSGVNTCHSGTPTGPQATHTAVAGDVINIPAGSATWTNSLSISANITLQGNGVPNSLPTQYGAGTLNTVITYNFTSTSLIVATVPYSAGALLRISSLDIEPGAAMVTPGQIVLSVVGTCTAAGCPNARIDNIYFGKTSPFNTAATDRPLIAVDNVFGVADHNQTNSGTNPHFIDVEHPAWQGIGAFGDNSWAQPDTFGTSSQFFSENNLVNFILAYSDTELSAQGAGGGIGGARSTHRFNQIFIPNNIQPSGVFGGHGLDTDGRPQGIRHVEAYGNTVNNTSGHSAGGIVDVRGGTAKVFGNTLIVSGSGSVFKSGISAAVYRNVYWDPDGWAACGGLSPFDTNDGTIYFSGTMTTTGSGVLVMTDGTQSFPTTGGGLAVPGAPYSVYNVTQGTGFTAEIASNTATTITIQPPISESCWASGKAATACGGTGGGTGGFNNGDSYQILRSTICADQFGRGMGALVSGNPPVPSAALNQVLDPAYEWDNVYAPTFSGSGGHNVSFSTTNRFLANRDYYTDGSNGSPAVQTSPTSPFTGATGIGFGTLANRPTTCTLGVGYWATDQGSWNSSSNTYAGGYTQGQLYTCVSVPTTINADLIYLGNTSTVGTVLTAAIGNASLVSNNCAPGTCAQWSTPGGSGTKFFVGANQSSFNNTSPVTLNGGGPTYAIGALNFNNIEYENNGSAVVYWPLNLNGLPASTNNMTVGVTVVSLPPVGTGTIDMWFIQDTFGSKSWAQAHKCANGNYGFTIESSVLTGGGSAEPCIDTGSSTGYAAAYNISMNYNETVAGLGAYGTYSSGGTATGSLGQTCTVTATGSVYGYTTLQGTNSLTGATVYLVATPGTPFSSAPTTATLSNGAANANPATCSGTITMTGMTLGGVATLSVHNYSTGALIGRQQVAVASHTNPSLVGFQIGQGENYSGVANFFYQNLMMTWTGTVPQDLFANSSGTGWSLAYTPYNYPHPLTVQATTLSPTSANFGTVQVGNSSVNINFTLTNNSASTITGISIANIGGAATSFVMQSTTCGTTLATSSSCTITMNFTPLTTGILSTTLTVTDSDPSSPQTAGLSGTGIIPSYAFTGGSSMTLNMPSSWKITRY